MVFNPFKGDKAPDLTSGSGFKKFARTKKSSGGSSSRRKSSGGSSSSASKRRAAEERMAAARSAQQATEIAKATKERLFADEQKRIETARQRIKSTGSQTTSKIFKESGTIK
jgi:hypothetical protein